MYLNFMCHTNMINDIKQSIKYVNETVNFNNYYSHSYKWQRKIKDFSKNIKNIIN